MLTLFGALDMMTVLDEDLDFSSYAQLNLYRYHNHVKPKVNQAIYKFEFDYPDPPLFDQVDFPLVQYQDGVYVYRPHYIYKGDEVRPLYCERVTRASIETDRGIPKIEVVVPMEPETFSRPNWSTDIGMHLKMQEYAPKWICEHYVTGRFGNKVRFTYIPVLINAEQRDDLSKARTILDRLVDACYKDIEGVRYNLF
ncbi:hypothetical protein D3C81_237690 [compost metagenome]